MYAFETDRAHLLEGGQWQGHGVTGLVEGQDHLCLANGVLPGKIHRLGAVFEALCLLGFSGPIEGLTKVKPGCGIAKQHAHNRIPARSNLFCPHPTSV